jgi:D-arabinose 1-dehydrogenase-like Zn-dependent alcohol dehydrogenase
LFYNSSILLSVSYPFSLFFCYPFPVLYTLRSFAQQRHPGIVGASDVLIIGLGGLGFQALGLALPMLGGAPLCADIRDEPLKVARARGCKTFIMTEKQSIAKIRKQSFDGTGIGGVIDFVGNTDTANFAEAILRKGGKHVICGLFGGMLAKPVIMFPLRARCIEGSFVGSFEEAKEMMEVLRGGQTTLPPHHFQSIMTASQSLLDLRDRKIVGRRIFQHDWPEAKV